MTTTVGVPAIGVRSIAGTFARALPSAVITSPSGTVSDVALSFTYSSPVSRAQYSYRFQIRSADGTTVLYDSFTVVSADDTDIPVDFLFSGGSSYQLWVKVADIFDTSDWATVTFDADLSDVNDFPVNELVGSVYEIGINGMGLMLDDNPQTPVRRKLQVLQAPRFATGDTPFSEAVERYTFLGQSSFKGGAGQIFGNRPDSDGARFMDSYGINPFEDDALQIVPSMALANFDAYATPYLVTLGDRWYMVTDDGELYGSVAGGGGAGSFTITGAGAPTSLTTDGTYWYYADGSDIFRNDTNADPVTAWATVNADVVRPCLDRMVCTYDNGAGQVVVTTLDDAGAEEVAGGRFLYPDTVDIPDLAAGDGYLWYIVNRGDQSQIHFWKVGSDDTYAAVALTLPQGQTAVALGFYLGNLFIRSVESDGLTCVIYRCVPSDGALTPEKVLDFTDGANDPSVGVFTPYGRYMLFSWRNLQSGISGVGAVDLSTGGYAKWIGISADKAVRGIAVLEDAIYFTLDTQGAYEQQATGTSGYLYTSISDLNSGLTKVFDEIRATFDPLGASTSVAIEYTLDGGTSYTALNADADTAGQTLLTEDIGREGRSVGLKITLTGSVKLRHIQVKLHALSLADHLLQLPVKCADSMVGLNGQPLPTNAPGGGINQVRTLEGLISTRVKLQDIDWAVNDSTTIWELVDVDTVLTSTFNPKENRNVMSGVATITLRRAV